MSKRKFSVLTSSTEEAAPTVKLPVCRELFPDQVENNSKRAKTDNFKVGDAVTVSYRYSVHARYHYWCWSRGGEKHGFISDAGKGSYEFESLPKDWKKVLQKEVINMKLADWEYRIYHKEKFYWSYKSWGVKLKPVIRFHQIQGKEKNEVTFSSDHSFSSS